MLYESVHKCIYCTHVFNCTKVYKHIYAVHLCVLQLYKSVHKGICCTKVCASVHAAKKCKQVYILDINLNDCICCTKECTSVLNSVPLRLPSDCVTGSLKI